MTTSATTPTVVLIGAFERDNFGDLLFYQLTKTYLGERGIVAGSVIGADMRSLLGTQVYPQSDLLAARAWDAVWVVGGEVGGVTTENALAMSLPEVEGAIFDAASTMGRTALSRFLSDSAPVDPAYLPVLSRFPLNEQTPLILNSVGLGNMAAEGSGPEADTAIAVLRGASAVNVRDTSSQDFAHSVGVSTRLAPDIVHSISLHHPELRWEHVPAHSPYFIFQASTTVIAKYGVENVARAIVNLAVQTGWRPVLLLAGLARHHDSPHQYEQVVQEIKRHSPHLTPAVLATRKPLELAAWIAQSQLWLGTSLHGRIIANSFLRPRVSLENLKVTHYAQTWDREFPVSVPLDQIGEAVSAAVIAAALPANSAVSLELAQASRRATEHLVTEYL
ncbi:hypothetical protein JF66_11805 [Cryobacterium sp. MLB-32]|uniref:polysaccharide pyruvyl transferase family protein n=1 Tax=Cryobacterium sp. MLB-32 TaxID=1529318 RepID=UPI0004E640D6|nr:polysaccharide pyruvyl transferase family protein [Cryobacterium sp. MLB-32]KFF59363.1 hypothetical protein JF66_11805 [Cryobacterium sp. MLB-32]